MTDPLGKTVEETGDELITTLTKYNNNIQKAVIFKNEWKKCNEIQLTKNKMNLNYRKLINHPPSSENTCIQIYIFIPLFRYTHFSVSFSTSRKINSKLYTLDKKDIIKQFMYTN